MNNEYKSFIEVQFPVSKISKESYKERKAGSGQTLTGLGKWWGRKPLILVRASILGLFMPSSDNYQKDREIFLKILTMDNEGLWIRKNKTISTKEIYEKLNLSEKGKYFQDIFSTKNVLKYKSGIKAEEKLYLQKLVFSGFNYDKKLEFCKRPEDVNQLALSVWDEINKHLSTSAKSFEELIIQLGQKKYGHAPKIGDCFSGGGSIPFEASRLGCEVYAVDLNPIASLLTWASLNIIGSSNDKVKKIISFQNSVYNKVDKQIIEWGVEHNEKGHRAGAYLYCNETICPECGYTVPLLPSFIVGKVSKTIIKLNKNTEEKNFEINIIQNVNSSDYNEAENGSTLKNYSLVCPSCYKSTPIPSIRRDIEDGIKRPYRYSTPNSLRKWEQEDFKFRIDDIFTERLYCIKYIETIEHNGKEKINKYYVSPSKQDILREEKVIKLLSNRFIKWQEEGFLPSSKIEEGWNTNQLIYEKGWTHWHHLFNPRQLLYNGLISSTMKHLAKDTKELAIGLIGLNRTTDWNSKLSRWHTDDTHTNAQTFYNQAFNTLFNYSVRAFSPLKNVWIADINSCNLHNKKSISIKDARDINEKCDIWITDPPYADAVNYHELTEFFLAWDKKMLPEIFPNCYTDSKRALAVKGVGQTFNDSMIEIYKNLANHMPDNGMQIVMFTHQDVKVWAELTMILWSAGLRVVSAWNIATETESGGLKNGNYVKGTVLLVLKKQISEETAFKDELYPKIKAEVKRQIDSMRAIDKGDEANFEDGDYLLASYASSLKVLTAYKQIEGIDVQYELSKGRSSKEVSPIEEIINKAKTIAYDYLIPSGFDQYLWRILSKEERFYIKGLELEKNKSHQLGAYQELATGFGVDNYKDLFENTKANKVRLKTPMEFKNTNLQNTNFGSTLTRNVLMALFQSVKAEDTVEGKNWLRAEYDKDELYWKNRKLILEILIFLSKFEAIEHMQHWHKSSEYAKLLKEVIKNDGV